MAISLGVGGGGRGGVGAGVGPSIGEGGMNRVGGMNSGNRHAQEDQEAEEDEEEDEEEEECRVYRFTWDDTMFQQAMKQSQHIDRQTKLEAFRLIRKEIQKQIHNIIWNK